MECCSTDVADWQVNYIHVVCILMKKKHFLEFACVGLERIDKWSTLLSSALILGNQDFNSCVVYVSCKLLKITIFAIKTKNIAFFSIF